MSAKPTHIPRHDTAPISLPSIVTPSVFMQMDPTVPAMRMGRPSRTLGDRVLFGLATLLALATTGFAAMGHVTQVEEEIPAATAITPVPETPDAPASAEAVAAAEPPVASTPLTGIEPLVIVPAPSASTHPSHGPRSPRWKIRLPARAPARAHAKK